MFARHLIKFQYKGMALTLSWTNLLIIIIVLLVPNLILSSA